MSGNQSKLSQGKIWCQSGVQKREQWRPLSSFDEGAARKKIYEIHRKRKEVNLQPQLSATLFGVLNTHQLH